MEGSLNHYYWESKLTLLFGVCFTCIFSNFKCMCSVPSNFPQIYQETHVLTCPSKGMGQANWWVPPMDHPAGATENGADPSVQMDSLQDHC